jgi:hypothetical protein
MKVGDLVRNPRDPSLLGIIFQTITYLNGSIRRHRVFWSKPKVWWTGLYDSYDERHLELVSEA